MKLPIWSILIATVPNRREPFGKLWDEIERQVNRIGMQNMIEILALCDNKARSVGYKRQTLLNQADGDFVSFVDDDDWVMPEYVDEISSAIIHDPLDLFTFPIKVTIGGEREGIVESSMKYVPKNGEPLAEYQPPVTYRPPQMLSVWRASIARKGTFPDESFRDDFAWAAQVWPHIKSEHRIDKILYHWVGRAQENAEETGS